MGQLEFTGERLVPGVYGKIAAEHLHRYALTFELAQNKMVLDIASGEGYGSNLLAKYAAEVVGVDISEQAVYHAQNAYPKKNLRFKIGSVLDIPCSSESFDLVVSFETIEHVTDQEKMISEIKRVLKPNGILVISTPEKSVYSDQANYSNPFHEKELYESEFVEILSQEFEYLQLGYQKFIKGSLFVPANQKAENLDIYQGEFQEIKSRNSLNQEYLIAICSDSTLKSFPISVFDSQELDRKQQELVDFRHKKLKLGFRYRLADYIFKPWDFLKGIRSK